MLRGLGPAGIRWLVLGAAGLVLAACLLHDPSDEAKPNDVRAQSVTDQIRAADLSPKAPFPTNDGGIGNPQGGAQLIEKITLSPNGNSYWSQGSPPPPPPPVPMAKRDEAAGDPYTTTATSHSPALIAAAACAVCATNDEPPILVESRKFGVRFK